MDLRDYIKVLRRHKWTVAGVMLLTLLFHTFVLNVAQTVRYESSARVLIRQIPTQDILVFQMSEQQPTGVSYSTRIALITSNPVLEDARKALLPKYPDVVVADLRQDLIVQEEKGTQFVRIIATTTDPRRSQDFANAVAEAFVRYDTQSARKALENAIRFTEDQIRVTNERFREVEQKIAKFSLGEKVYSVDEQIRTRIQRLTDLEQAKIQAEIELAQTDRMILEKRGILSAPERHPDAPLPQTPAITSLKARAADLEVALATGQNVYTPEHPRMKELTDELAGIRRQLAGNIRRLGVQEEIGQFAIQRDIARTKIATLTETIRREDDRLAHFSGKKIDYLRHERLANMLEKTIVNLQTSLEELQLKRSLTADNVEVHEIARESAPLRKIGMETLPFIIILAVIVGVSSAYLIEYLNDTIRSPHDVKQFLNLPLLGSIPRERGDILLHRVATKSPLAELYHALATFLEAYALEHAVKAFVIASTKSQEGKSTVSTNLAIALAQGGEHVILVDADLRRSQIHKFFALDNAAGLATVLSGEWEAETLLRKMRGPGAPPDPRPVPLQATSVPGLQVLTTGPLPPNPVNLLKSARMKTLLEQLKSQADIVLIDTPPMTAVIDGGILASLADAAVLVVGEGETSRHEAAQTKHALAQVNARITGVILNKVHLFGQDYYYYYNYGKGPREESALRR
ncbi:MAG: polysaccharide biosynthesis tyrosine autokinase [Planctomycetota bacterium]